MHLSTPLATLFGLTVTVLPLISACGPGSDHTRRSIEEMKERSRVRRLLARDNQAHPEWLRNAKRGMEWAAEAEHERSKRDMTSQSALKDPKAECAPYSYDVLATFPKYPTVWDTATLIDDEAKKAFAAIQGGIPKNIQPRGKPNGDWTGITYDMVNDPACWWTNRECTTPKLAGLVPDNTKCLQPNTWGLTFDDGPNCTHNAFYDFLKTNKQQATMYFVGSNVIDWPFQAQRAIADGHEICIHTWSHQYLTALSNEQVFAEIWYTARAIKEVMGITTSCFRPPFGDIDDRVRYIAKSMGMSVDLWAENTDDWEILPAGTKPVAAIDANYKAIFDKSTGGMFNQQGPIVLTHEINGATMNEFIKQYPALKAAFKNVVPLNACLNRAHPYVENIVYPTFDQYTKGQLMPTGAPTSFNPVAGFALPHINQTASTGNNPAQTTGKGGKPGPTGASGNPSGGTDTQNNDKSAAGRVSVAGSVMAALSLAVVGVQALL